MFYPSLRRRTCFRVGHEIWCLLCELHDQMSGTDQSHLCSACRMAMCSVLCMLSTFFFLQKLQVSLVGCKSFFVFMTYNHNLPSYVLSNSTITPRPLHQNSHAVGCSIARDVCFISQNFFFLSFFGFVALFLRQTLIQR